MTQEKSTHKGELIRPGDPIYGVLSDEQVGLDESIGRPKITAEVLDAMRQYLSAHDLT